MVLSHLMLDCHPKQTEMLSASHEELITPESCPSRPIEKNKLFVDEFELTTVSIPMALPVDCRECSKTYGMHILQTPDKSWKNWLIARTMYVSR